MMIQPLFNTENIDTLVFDYGAVIANLNVKKVRKALSKLGFSRLKQWWYRKECHRIMHDYTNGVRLYEEVLQELLPYCRRGTTTAQLLTAVNCVCDPLLKSRLEALIFLRKKYRIYLLSNINEPLWNDAVKAFESLGYTVEDCFNKVFLSYELQCAKPDPAIYQKLIETTGLIPSRTLYFDDRKENIIAGNEAHLNAVLIDFNNIESNKEYQELLRNFS